MKEWLCHVLKAKKKLTPEDLEISGLCYSASGEPWTNLLDFRVSRSLASNRTIQNRVLSRDKDFQKKFLKWSENDELSEEYLQSDSKPINFYSIIEHLTNEQFSS